MRIISGKYGGQTFSDPKGHKTHPMSEKARGSIFNTLGDISGMSVLDAFSGTGALGLEALSRGANKVVAVEIDKNAYSQISDSVHIFGFGSEMKAVRANVSSWSDNNSEQKFDLIFCDPPYDNPQISTVKNISKHLAHEGIFVLSWPSDQDAPEFENLKYIKQNELGDIKVVFFGHK